MTRAASRAYLFIGGTLILVAFVLGFLPFSIRDAPCGSPFVATSAPFDVDLRTAWADASDIADAAGTGSHQRACERRRSELRLASVVLLGSGIAALLTHRLVHRRATGTVGLEDRAPTT